MNKKLVKELKLLYAEIRPEIEGRIKDFKSTGKNMDKSELFYELGFCLFTPQSKATMCWNSICSIKKNMKKNHRSKEILPLLNGVRFKYKKAGYFEEAQKKWHGFKETPFYDDLFSFTDSREMREHLVKNIKGLGYKEASHFLRNIGKGDELAILDRHILKNLRLLGIIESVPKSITKNSYLDIEKRMASFAKKISIPLSHLDFVMWYKEAGRVFK